MSAAFSVAAIDQTDAAIAGRLHALRQLAYTQEAALLGAVWFPPLAETIDELRASTEHFTAVFVGEQLAGAIGTEPDADEPGATTIASLVVAPAFQRRGIARALMTQVLHEHGDGVLTVQTGTGNAPALALYASFGFEPLRRWRVGPEPLELVKLRRPAPQPPAARP